MTEKVDIIYEGIVDEDDIDENQIIEINPETEDIEQKEIKSRLQQFEKRATRSYKKNEDDINDEENNVQKPNLINKCSLDPWKYQEIDFKNRSTIEELVLVNIKTKF